MTGGWKDFLKGIASNYFSNQHAQPRSSRTHLTAAFKNKEMALQAKSIKSVKESGNTL